MDYGKVEAVGHLWRFFYSGHGVKTGCILVTEEMKMYIYVHMPSFFVAEASPSVRFVTASLCNVVMGKKI